MGSVPPDWVYVYDFANADRPNAIRLPAGRGAELAAAIGESAAKSLRDDVELVRGATPEFDHAQYLAGRQTPVFFGAAIHNGFGARSAMCR